MEAIRYYVKGAFQGVKETPQVLEQQEELIADISAKVEDLVSEGKTREEALGAAIASMGELSALVDEFRAEQEALNLSADAPLVPTVEVYSGSLEFHIAAITTGVVALLMLLCTAAGAATDTIFGFVGVILLALLVAAAWWLRETYIRSAPRWSEVETRGLVQGKRLLKSIGLAAAIAFVAVFVNLNFQRNDFWFWPLWVAATALPIRLMVEWFAIRQGWFLAEDASLTVEIDQFA